MFQKSERSFFDQWSIDIKSAVTFSKMLFLFLGSLHLHMMIWLKGYCSPSELRKRMSEDPSFKEDLLTYLESMIKQDIGESAQNVLDDDKAEEVLTRRPCNPKNKTFRQNMTRDLKQLVPLVQTHRHTDSCYKYDSDSCRYGFDRPIVKCSYVNEHYEIFLRRLDAKINNYEEHITESVRCNMDIKFLPSGKDCRAISFYVTEYQTKNELSTYNTLEILESVQSAIEKCGTPILGAKKLLKMLNRVLTEKEVSTPHVAHLCLGNDDKYSSHQFRTANMHLMLSWIKEEEMRNGRSQQLDDESEDVWMNLETDDNENYILVNQEMDYHRRGAGLEEMCFYDYVSNIEKISRKDNKEHKQQSALGRPLLPRFEFDSTHPQSKTHIQRQRQLKLVPKLSLFPPSESRDKEVFSKMMLLLFKPHKELHDLKTEETSWEDAFTNCLFEEDHMMKIQNIREMHIGFKERDDIRQKLSEVEKGDQASEISELAEYAAIFDVDPREMFEEDLDLEFEDVDHKDDTRNHCAQGVRILNESKIQFKRFENVRDDCSLHDIDTQTLKQWNREIHHQREDVILNRQGQRKEGTNEAIVIDEHVEPCWEPLKLPPIEPSYMKTAQEVCDYFELNAQQQQIYWLIIDNVIKRLAGEKTKQIIAHMGGMAGCGKSRVIKSIREFHIRVKIQNELRIASPTGTSASLIGGSTVHSIAKIMPTRLKSKKTSQNSKLEEIWGGVRLLICDEISMVGTNLLALLSKAITLGKHCDASVPFGDIDVLLTGNSKELLKSGMIIDM